MNDQFVFDEPTKPAPAVVRSEPAQSLRERWDNFCDSTTLGRRGYAVTGGVIALMCFLGSTRSQPGLWVLFNYFCLFLGVRLIAVAVIGQWWPEPRSMWVGFGLAIAALFMWAPFDRYDHHWSSRSGADYVDTTTRFTSRVVYRHVDHNDSDDWSSYGPMAGDPSKPHGRWHDHWSKPSWGSRDHWYWYGDQISQGEWELRNR